jgi:hypothetical protein
MNTKYKVMNWIGYFTLVLTTLFIASVAMFLYYPVDPFTVKSQPYTCNMDGSPKDVFYIGQPITFYLDYCKNTDASATVNYTLIDGVSYSLPAVETSRPQGCFKGVITSGLLIPNLPSGEYYLAWKATYRMNPLRTFVEEFKTNKFKIINTKD